MNDLTALQNHETIGSVEEYPTRSTQNDDEKKSVNEALSGKTRVELTSVGSPLIRINFGKSRDEQFEFSFGEDLHQILRNDFVKSLQKGLFRAHTAVSYRISTTTCERAHERGRENSHPFDL